MPWVLSHNTPPYHDSYPIMLPTNGCMFELEGVEGVIEHGSRLLTLRVEYHHTSALLRTKRRHQAYAGPFHRFSASTRAAECQ